MALMIGAGLALLCLAYVLYPVVSGRRPQAGPVGSSESLGARTGVTDEEIEAAITAYRSKHVIGDRCATCGPRPESNAVFCSNCGRRLVNQTDSA